MFTSLLPAVVLVICCIRSTAGKQTLACGTTTNPCRLLVFQCLPGERIEIIRAYDVVKDTRLHCQEDVTRCTPTYKSNCCSGSTRNDLTINFTSSRIHTVKDHCDNKHICSDIILTHTSNVHVVEYNCKTELPTKSTRRKPINNPYILVTSICGSFGACLLVAACCFATLYICKRIKDSRMDESEEHYIHVL